MAKVVRSATCPHCEQVFDITYGLCQHFRKYCSDDCFAEAKRCRDRERQRAYWRTRPPCHYPGCGRPIASVTLCAGHYRQSRGGVPLAPLHPKAPHGKRGPVASDRPGRARLDGLTCGLPGCERPMHSKGMCSPHDSQRRKTTLTTAQLVIWYQDQEGRCSYCAEALSIKYEIDHAHDGTCTTPHREERMCPDCIRGLVHKRCNEELKWLERAIRAGRITAPSPLVLAYLTGRPFRD